MCRYIAFITFSFVAGCATHDDSGTCDLSAELVARAGSDHVDCGYASLQSDPTSVDDCVRSAFNAGQAFSARYDRHGTDSKVVFGIARDSSGNVFFLLWDSDPSGGSGAHETIDVSSCSEPEIDTSVPRDSFQTPPIACKSVLALGRVCS